VGIASVAGGFPSSQTYLEIKLLEAKMAVDSGASEIDIVIPMRHYLENRMQALQDEIRQIKDRIGSVKLKVILETGLLPGPADIYAVSRASLDAGADFIKTSTGKEQPAASPEAVYVMCHAILDHYNTTGKRAGIKPAGGIGTAEQVLRYAGIVELLLGDDWLDPGLFRIGASRLANQILTELNQLDTGSSDELKYF
jgi:deoxyribose-phosphate aldolase